MKENRILTGKQGITQVGLRYAVFGVVVTAVQLAVAALLRKFAPGLVEDNAVLLSFLLIIFSVDMVGFPLVYLLNRKLPAAELEQHDLGVKRFLLGILFCAGICGAGAIIGTIIHMAVSRLCGVDSNANNAVAILMMESKPFMRILTVGILAPIFEELIFRKVLVDHLVKYGKWVAVVASGLLFGLFHGNFSQFFFAAGLGFFFAFIYIRTGKIRYTIGYHMVINLTTSVGTMTVLSKYFAMMEEVGEEALLAGSEEVVMAALPVTLLMIGWFGLLVVCGLVGVVLLCLNRKKFRMPEGEEGPTLWGAWKTVLCNPGMLAFVAVCLFLFAKTYLLG